MFPKIVFSIILLLLSVAAYRRSRVLPPAVILLLFSVLFSRIYWRTGAFTLRWESIACLLVFLNFVYDLGKKRIAFALDIRISLVIVLFVLMIIPSALVSPTPLLSLKRTLIFIPYILAFAALVHYFRKKETLTAAWDYFYAGGILALSISVVGLILFMAGIDLGMVRMGMATLWLRGTSIIPNILGSTAVLILAAALIRWDSPDAAVSRKPGWNALALVSTSACVLTSMTRSAWMCAAFGTVIITLYGLKNRRWKQIISGLLIIGATLGGTYFLTTRIPARISPIPAGRSLGEFGEPGIDIYWKGTPLQTRFNYWTKSGIGQGRNRTLVFREETAQSALGDWRSSPVIGKGTESLAISHKFSPAYYISSSWISILHDWGILGLGVYLAFLVLVLIGMVRVFWSAPSPQIRGLALSLLLILFLSSIMSQSAATHQLSIFWVLLAFFAGASSPSLLNKEEVEPPSAPGKQRSRAAFAPRG